MTITPYSQSNYTGNYGALSAIEQDDGSYTYPVYGVEANTYTGGENLQDLYGTAELPMFKWVQRIQTGEGSFNPEDPADNEMLKKYEEFLKNNPEADLPTTGDLIRGIATPFAASVGSQVLPTYLSGGTASDIASSAATGFKDVYSTTSADVAAGTTSFPKNALGDLAPTEVNKKLAGNLSKNLTMDTSTATEILGSEEAVKKAGGIVGTEFSKGGNAGDLLNFNTESGAANWTSAAGAGLGTFAIGLVTGQDPVKAAKSAGATVIGKAFGTALFGPLGGFLGGALGGMFGGRVICNELMRQGLADRKQVVMDYKFTRDYLTPTHVKGYHVWAVWMVKQMRKGRFVKFWGHVAGHRANEIAYIYGERSKPDYLGKVYRKIFEPVCWLVGSFCEKTDWSILYNKKEI